ncbi:MAG: BCCT family transporter [Clostridiales bacterium]
MKLLGKVDKTIFSGTVIIYLIIFLSILVVPATANKVINSMMDFTLNTVGWVFIIAYVFIFFTFLAIGLSKYGKMRLGSVDSKPEYSFFSWMGMLFGAGLGVGLVFYGVTEPVTHFMTAPFAQSGTAQAAADAMRTTFFHWSFLPWSMYGMIGLCMGYFIHKKGLPGLISSTFAPMLGETNTRGKIGKIIDTFSLIAVICGVSISIGFAATQLSSGLNLQYGLNNSFWVICLVTILIGFIATLSCISGVEKGIKIISDGNMYIVLFFLAFTLIFGSTTYLINSFFENFGNMLGSLPWLLFYMDSYGVVQTNTGYNWIGGWTIMYWAWWAAFGPFVGGFLANISKGRTIREFVLACVIIPGALCCLWFTFFGGEAIHMALTGNEHLGAAIMANTDNSLFVFLAELPIPKITIPLSMVLIVTLIVTSVNSATYVASTFSAGGEGIPTLGIRGFWGIFIVANAIAFMAIGGLATLKNAAIILAFPFIIIVILMVVNLLKDLKKSYALERKNL